MALAQPQSRFNTSTSAATAASASWSSFRLDRPDALNFQQIEAEVPPNQRGQWRLMATLFETALDYRCTQFCIEPDASLWRVRYRSPSGFDEHIVDDPSDLIWSLNGLIALLWGEQQDDCTDKHARFTWVREPEAQVVNIRVIETVHGTTLHVDLEPVVAVPPLIDELVGCSEVLQALRQRLNHLQGMLLVTSSDPLGLDNTMLGINQALVSPDRQLLSFSNLHRYSMPRTTQIQVPDINEQNALRVWQNALSGYHDVLLLNAAIPSTLHDSIADASDQGVLTIQAMQNRRPADAVALLNAAVLRRAPLHRTVNTLLCHHTVQTNCEHCRVSATLDQDTAAWVEHLRTPITEDVLAWLNDGDTKRFQVGEGCDHCKNTGRGPLLSVYDLRHRDELSNQFPSYSSIKTKAANPTLPTALQAQLMELAGSGRIRLEEVVRVIQLS